MSNSSNAVHSYEIDPGAQSPREKGQRWFGDAGRRYSTVLENRTTQGDDQEDFPQDLFTYEQRRHGALLLHVFLGFYCFLLTAFVCHNYLLPALDRICVSANISTDVAGATFLAMASSLPELFVNMIGTFLTESDLGVGTVVGSAVFDTFATPAVGALAAFHVSKRSLCRIPWTRAYVSVHAIENSPNDKLITVESEQFPSQQCSPTVRTAN